MQFLFRSTLRFIALIFMCILSIHASHAAFFGASVDDAYICEDPAACGIDVSIDTAKDTINWIEADRSLSEYVIDVILYLLTFLALVATVIIIYAWFTILVSAGDEEKLKSARKIILYVLIGMFVILSAYLIVLFMVDLFNVAPTV